MRKGFSIASWVVALVLSPAWSGAGADPGASTQRWPEARANAWYAAQPWLVGSNYVPANAINQLEMWQAASFDPARIDRELGWAEGLGMNTMRVFLHDLLWLQDAAGFTQRIGTFLSIADRHHIRTMFVLFDSDWEEEPRLGPQHPPIPGVHNSGWVQGPGISALKDPAQLARLRAYVQGVTGAFGADRRVLAWDLWNEPAATPEVIALLPQVFDWVREVHPSQPLTSGVADLASPPNAVTGVQLAQSDVISFHNYKWPEEFDSDVRRLEQHHRPVLCTEFMARTVGSTFDTILPIARQRHVAAINWGLVAGRTQTWLPWDTWQRPYTGKDMPAVWFHDVLREDGTPFREREAQLLRELTGHARQRVAREEVDDQR